MTAFPPLVIRGRFFVPWCIWPPCGLCSRFPSHQLPAHRGGLFYALPVWRLYRLSKRFIFQRYHSSSAYIIGLCWLSSVATAYAAHNTAIARAVQSLYGPFSGGGKLHRLGSCQRGHGPLVAVIPGPENRRFFAGNLKDFLLEIFSRIFRRS